MFLFCREEESQTDEAAGRAKMGKKRRDKVQTARLLEEGVAVEMESTNASPMGGRLEAGMGGPDAEVDEAVLVGKQSGSVNAMSAAEEAPGTSPAPPATLGAKAAQPAKKKKLRRRNVRLGSRVTMGGRVFSGSRLQAYGLDPRKLRYKLMNRGKKKQGKKQTRA